jgi:hypothetical protein
MMQRVLIEFVVDVPDAGVAGDVETRIAREHHGKLCEVLQSVTGYAPLRAPGQHGLLVASELVTWNAAEQEWIGHDDEDDDEDE